MQEQIDVAKRPNLPAGDYWVNNKDNTFKKENEQNRPLQQEATAKKSGTLPGITIPMGRSGDVISPVPRGDSPLLRTGVSEPVRAVKPLEPTGIPGFLPPPGSFGTVEMTMAQGTANQGPASEQMQARCGRVTDLGYIQGFLKTQIGRQVKIEFVVGTNMFIDREGYLVDVGIDYLIINETNTDDYLLCDMYSIKFVKIFF